MTRILSESPDYVGVKGKGKILVWHNVGYPFGYDYDRKTMLVGDDTDTHANMISVTDDENRYHTRQSLGFPGRLWPLDKVISFWSFPARNTLKKVFQDIEKAFQAEHKIKLNLLSDKKWRMDIPKLKHTGGYKTLPGSADAIWISTKTVSPSWFKDEDKLRMMIARGTWKEVFEDYSYLYSIKTILSNKPLKGIGQSWDGKLMLTPAGQDHLDAPIKKMLKKGKKMNDKQWADMEQYLRARGQMDPQLARMHIIIQQMQKEHAIRNFSSRLLTEELLAMYRKSLIK